MHLTFRLIIRAWEFRLGKSNWQIQALFLTFSTWMSSLKRSHSSRGFFGIRLDPESYQVYSQKLLCGFPARGVLERGGRSPPQLWLCWSSLAPDCELCSPLLLFICSWSSCCSLYILLRSHSRSQLIFDLRNQVAISPVVLAKLSVSRGGPI